MICWSFPKGLVGRESICNAGDTGDLASMPGWGRSPGGRNGNPLWYSCLENLMDRRAWLAVAHGVAKSQTWLSDWGHRPWTCLVPGVETWARKLKQGFYTLGLAHGGCVIMTHSASADLTFLTCEMNIIHGGLVAKSCPTLATPWTGACQAPLSMGFSRQEYWSGLPSPSPGYLPNPGVVCRQILYRLSWWT